LALGSPTHPIPTACWDAWARPQGDYAGHRTFTAGPLFEHQYSQAFVDFRGLQDRLGFDYWQSSVEATLANRQFCIDQAHRFHTYSDEVWGLSACDGPGGYRAYGAPPGHIEQDGTVAPLSVVASVPFTPELCISAMRTIQAEYATKVWGRYGFCDGFSVDRNWYDHDVIGIDAGCALLMLENYHSGLVWQLLGQDPAVRRGLETAGFHRANGAAFARVAGVRRHMFPVARLKSALSGASANKPPSQQRSLFSAQAESWPQPGQRRCQASGIGCHSCPSYRSDGH